MTEKPPASEWPDALRLDDQPGPAAYITRTKSDAIIASALEQAGFQETPIAPVVTPSGFVKRKGRAGARLVAAVALVAFFGVGSASAAVMWYLETRSEPTLEQAPSPAPKPRRSVRRDKPRQETQATPPTPALLPEMVVEATPRERRAPEDWLEEGNRMRAERRWARADEAYSRALESAPRSQTAYVARVASAAVRLEHLNDARGALSLYRAALRQSPDGALREEILLGIADAERALGDRSAERRALERLLDEYPRSAHGDEARARLAQ